MGQSGNISYLPTEGLSYDPGEARYFDDAALAKETRRVFEICHGCRMCFKYCDSFPSLFRAIDEQHDGQVAELTPAETARVMDTCFQCKLCEVQCPYTPRDGHEYQLDFPKLVHRYRAVHARRRSFSLRRQFLGRPDFAAKLSRASLGLANVLARSRPNRWLLEKTLGVHRDKLLPPFAAESFEAWAEKTGRIAARPGGEAVLFQTCYVQNNEPAVGRDTLEVLDANRVDVACVKGLRCCGMPAWEQGDLGTLRAQARQNLAVLMPFVEQGAKVLVINPTCSMMMRREYPTLLGGVDRGRAELLARAVMDVSEFLWSIRSEPRFNTHFRSSPNGPVAYHAPCHLRAQAVGFKGRDLLRKIPGVQPVSVMECCGHNGTFAMTLEGFGPSARLGQKAFAAMKNAGAEVWASDCPLAAIQFQQHAGKRPLHPMSILARAYREDGFAHKIAPEGSSV